MAPRASESVLREHSPAPHQFMRREFAWLILMWGLLLVADESNGQQTSPTSDTKATQPAEVDDDEPAAKSDASRPSSEASAKTVSYHGTVVDEEGNAIPNAELWYALPTALSTPLGEVIGSGEIRKVATTGADGKFSFSVAPHYWNGHQHSLDIVPLTAKAPGYGCDLLPLVAFESEPVESEHRTRVQSQTDAGLGAGRFASRTLMLPREAGPVEGRLLDLEGRPLVGVEIRVETVERVRTDLLKQALEKSDPRLGQQARHKRPLMVLSSTDWQLLLPPPKTDENGVFVLRGLGKNQLATVTLYHERVEAETLNILGADMEPQQLPRASSGGLSRKEPYFGTKFTYAVGPGVPVTGVVTELQSGKPVANATVAIERLFSGTARNAEPQLRFARHIRAVTDEQGRYRLIGVPPGEGHVLDVIPSTSKPLFPMTEVFAIPSADANVTMNVTLFRGLWIQGKVTDEQTGEPIQGAVDYFPFRNNADSKQIDGPFGGARWHRFTINKQGHYRVPGLPGKGVVMVVSSGSKVYPKAAGAEKIEGYDTIGKRLNNTVMVRPPLVNWNHISLVVPPGGRTTYQHDIQLTAGLLVHGRVVSADGMPVTGLDVLGEAPQDRLFRRSKDDTFTILHYAKNEPRDIFFWVKERSLVGYLHLEGEVPQDLKVELQAAVTVRGRLIDAQNNEPAARFRLLFRSTKLGPFGTNNVMATDDDGLFEFKGLLAGNVYQMAAVNGEAVMDQRNSFTIDLTNAKPGDQIDLRDVTQKAPDDKP